jgi:hypothetical protein
VGAWDAMLRAMEDPIDSGDTPVMRTMRGNQRDIASLDGGWCTFFPADLVCESLRDFETACLFVPFRVSQCSVCHPEDWLSSSTCCFLRHATNMIQNMQHNAPLAFQHPSSECLARSWYSPLLSPTDPRS